MMRTSTVIVLLSVITGSQAMALETPEYTVLYKEGNIEYRQYQPYLVAETEVTGESSRNKAANAGFMRLFEYITGANSAQAKIAMTAPVRQEQLGESIDMTAPVQQTKSTSGWQIAFMLPVKFSLENAPVPADARIRVREMPGRLMAVIRYSGRWTTKNVEKYEAVLVAHLQANRIAPAGGAETAAYNAPFTPPFMRRNEIMLEVVTYPGAGHEVARESGQQQPIQ